MRPAPAMTTITAKPLRPEHESSQDNTATPYPKVKLFNWFLTKVCLRQKDHQDQ
jgi:hypothetical protein